jgi:hypothetical protein
MIGIRKKLAQINISGCNREAQTLAGRGENQTHCSDRHQQVDNPLAGFASQLALSEVRTHGQACAQRQRQQPTQQTTTGAKLKYAERDNGSDDNSQPHGDRQRVAATSYDVPGGCTARQHRRTTSRDSRARCNAAQSLRGDGVDSPELAPCENPNSLRAVH